MTKIVFETEINQLSMSVEDGGAAVILDPEWKVEKKYEDLFVRIQSWDESVFESLDDDDAHTKNKYERYKEGHQGIQELFNKKIRVTIEVIGDTDKETIK